MTDFWSLYPSHCPLYDVVVFLAHPDERRLVGQDVRARHDDLLRVPPPHLVDVEPAGLDDAGGVRLALEAANLHGEVQQAEAGREEEAHVVGLPAHHLVG